MIARPDESQVLITWSQPAWSLTRACVASWATACMASWATACTAWWTMFQGSSAYSLVTACVACWATLDGSERIELVILSLRNDSEVPAE